jgi:Delta7-sterol 5-desaturase
MLRFLSSQSPFNLWMIFLAENFLVTISSLLFGWAILKFLKKPVKAATTNEWLICVLTNFINTAITFFGFWLWKQGYIIFTFGIDYGIIISFIGIFLLMDLFMYIFHYIIHHSALYKLVHRFHHHYHDPIPIDLYVLHPLETVSFGLLWLITIMLFNFNLYAVFIYLCANVAFGIIGHLGIEPLSPKIRGMIPFKYLGTSSFHHVHHQDVGYNFGFYTNFWDKLFKTYKA